MKTPEIPPKIPSEITEVVEGTPPRAVWTSQRAYILASIAGVVGLGNLWRFPYMAGENGGAVFLLAYVICALTIGLSLHVLETSAGKLTQRGPVGLFRRINAKWGRWFGWSLVLIVTLIMSYYLVVSGWTLGYAVDSVRFDLKPFDQFTAGFATLWFFFATAALTFLVLLRGIGGLEQMSKILLPLLVVIVGGLAIYSQTLPGAGEARQFYLNVDPEGLLEPRLWRMAAAQAFYSLGVGQGLLIAYGSYSPKHFNKVLSSSAVALTNTTICFLSGLMVFPIVFTFAIAPDTGSHLSFVALPLMLDQLPGGQIVGIAFYLLLFVAAFTSCVGGMAAILAPMRDQLHMSRRKAAVAVTLLVTVLGIPSALSFTAVGLDVGGVPFLDVIDQLTGSGIVIVAGVAGAALISWMLPRKLLLEAINTPTRRLGPIVISADIIIWVGRYLPIVATAVWLVTYLI